MKLDKEAALIEAVIFLEAEPVEVKTIAKILGIAENVVETVVQEIQKKYETEDHGLELIRIGMGVQFSPKRDLWDALKHRYGKKNDSKLSRAALETLSIIAYSQPITRGEIDNIRGVASDGMIKLLLAKEFIQEVGKKDAPGRPSQFGTTRNFLKVFRLSSIADLPKLDDLERERFELDRKQQG